MLANTYAIYPEYTNDEKRVALENIENRKKQKELEKKTVEELNELGYTQLFMEVAKTDIFVIVKYPEFTNLDAAKIMSTIYKNFNTNYVIEIALKS